MGQGVTNALLLGAEGSRGNFGIAPPAVINPLAAYQSAAQAAGTIYDLRQKQANQAIGSILQQSTDANGNVDYNKAKTLAAGAGPVVQMGMQDFLLNSSRLRGEQLSQANANMGLVGAASISLAADPSDANLAMVRMRLLNAGVPQDQVDKEISTLAPMGPDQRRAYVVENGIAAMDAGSRVGAAYGTVGTYNAPQGLVGTFQGGLLQGGQLRPTGTIPAGPSPGQYGTPLERSVPLDAQGQPLQPAPGGGWMHTDGSPGTPSGKYVTTQEPAGARPGWFGPGYPGAGGGGAGGGAPAGAGTGGGGGAPSAFPNQGRLRNPNAPQQPPPSPAVVTSPPTGTGQNVEAAQKMYQDDAAAQNDIARRVDAGERSLEALNLVNSIGKGTGWRQAVSEFFEANNIAEPGANLTPAEATEFLKKNLLKFSQDQAGGTDLARHLGMESTANIDMLSPVIRKTLLEDLATLRQQQAMFKSGNANDPVGYINLRGRFPSDTDRNAFAFDLMNDQERGQYLHSIDPNGTHDTPGYTRWRASMNIARNTNVFRHAPGSPQAGGAATPAQPAQPPAPSVPTGGAPAPLVSTQQ